MLRRKSHSAREKVFFVMERLGHRTKSRDVTGTFFRTARQAHISTSEKGHRPAEMFNIISQGRIKKFERVLSAESWVGESTLCQEIHDNLLTGV